MNTRNNNTKKTAFCKVCMDAGKGPEIYNSHYVKGDAGKVTCPTLLAMECRFCFKSGHTVKYCVTLEKKKQLDAKQIKQNTQKNPVRKASVAPAPISKNTYDCLANNSDNEEENTYAVDTFTSKPLSRTVNAHIPSPSPSQITWASVAAQSAPIIAPEPEPQPHRNLVAIQDILAEAEKSESTSFVSLSYFKKYKTKSWADWSDSDEE